MARRPPGQSARSGDRRTEFRPVRERILIVCEGEKTEPAYFEALIRYHRLNTVALDDGRLLNVSVDGAGRVARSLVEYAEGQQVPEPDNYATIWCVFDKDDLPDDDFDNAITKTDGHPFLRAAWSNEAFELWYILHFQYLDTAPAGGKKLRPRNYYVTQLHKHVKVLGKQSYRKNDENLYELLGPERQKTALRNARTLMARYRPDEAPHCRKPATSVYELVALLLSYSPEAVAPSESDG